MASEEGTGQAGPSSGAEYRVERLGIVLQPDPDRPEEIGGVLNPAAARDPGGALLLFPRLVDEQGISRIGCARAQADQPGGVERLGITLAPEAPYERTGQGAGGCEDPRITYVEPLRRYVMAYTALGPDGPRIALAVSADLVAWERLGPVRFAPEAALSLDATPNKDGVFFPAPVAGPDGRPALAMLHRPMFDRKMPAGIPNPARSIWISYCLLDAARRDSRALCRLAAHRLLIAPEHTWEARSIGAGTPPIRTPGGWLLLYHGSREVALPADAGRKPVIYGAGLLLLDGDDPRRVLFRSAAPIMRPEIPEEWDGPIAGGVFPTGTDDRGTGHFDIYYGMADRRIGVARLWLPVTPEEHEGPGRDRQASAERGAAARERRDPRDPLP